MKPSTVLAVALTNTVAADHMCPASLGKSDTAALVFSYKVQELINSYYKSIPVNATFFDDIPMASTKGMNGMTRAENTVANVEGLAKQAELGAEATMKAAMMSMGSDAKNDKMPPQCNFMYPPTPDGMTHLKHAFFLEASLCGTFIGMADYVQSPEAAFLMARLSAEHGIHASALRAQMQDVGFHANSTSLTPAFTSETVVSSSDSEEVGKLGKWLNGCAKALSAPCGGTLEIGPMLATLNGQKGKGDSGNDDNDSGNNGGNDSHNDDDDKDSNDDSDNDSDDDNDSSMGNGAPSQTSMGSSQTSPTNVPATAAAVGMKPLGGTAVVMAAAVAALLF